MLRRPGIAGTLVGARSARQLTDTLGALALDLPAAVLDRLTEVSAPELPFPHNILARFS
ncbi:hypothetical protein ABZU76_12195 [Amycolatopsis sp. NPDC005232]|uniref:hypothetical protein n=1 Tax=Amycolatopsis sp. NPDC005232 TaxID=3157027 RepID=UPI0033A32F27